MFYHSKCFADKKPVSLWTRLSSFSIVANRRALIFVDVDDDVFVDDVVVFVEDNVVVVDAAAALAVDDDALAVDSAMLTQRALRKRLYLLSQFGDFSILAIELQVLVHVQAAMLRSDCRIRQSKKNILLNHK